MGMVAGIKCNVFHPAGTDRGSKVPDRVPVPRVSQVNIRVERHIFRAHAHMLFQSSFSKIRHQIIPIPLDVLDALTRPIRIGFWKLYFPGSQREDAFLRFGRTIPSHLLSRDTESKISFLLVLGTPWKPPQFFTMTKSQKCVFSLEIQS